MAIQIFLSIPSSLLVIFLAQAIPTQSFTLPINTQLKGGRSTASTSIPITSLSAYNATADSFVNDFFEARPLGLKEDDLCGNSNSCDLLYEEIVESVDLARESARVESFASYIVVSCLTATASFSTIQNLDFGISNGLCSLQTFEMVVAALSTLGGIYSTVVFSLCSAYGRASLGMGKDVVYERFMKESQSLRSKAFQTYICALGLFLVELTVVTAEKLNPEVQYPFLFSFLVFTGLALRDWKTIADLAAIMFVDDANK